MNFILIKILKIKKQCVLYCLCAIKLIISPFCCLRALISILSRKNLSNIKVLYLDDIDWDNVKRLEHNYDAKRLIADYGGLSISDYKDGIAYVSWMLYPDGRYFADEDGFGMEDNDEVNISAYIDTQCRVVVKFQDMEDDEKRKRLREEALKALSEDER